MSKKLLAKASLIQLPPAPAAVPVERDKGSGAGGTVSAGAPGAPVAEGFREPPPSPEPRAKTAPGTMAHFMVTQSAAMKEAEELRERLKAFDGAQPVLALDARTVRPSRWANRHAASFADAAFEELKNEIASAGGNVQPVSVRRLAAPGEGGETHELVFGHRRHRACLELGLPLLAMVVEADDRQLFEAMERENRSRKNLSAWEQGTMYRRALDEGLYPSQRKLSEALGVDVALVSKSLALARLPEAVVRAFATPLDIQFRWAQPLSEAIQKDPEAVLARAAALQGDTRPKLPAQVLARLLGQEPVLNGSTGSRTTTLKGPAGRQAVWATRGDGGLSISFTPGALDPAAEDTLRQTVERLLQRP